MTPEEREVAATACPTCHTRTLPDPFVYSVVASYACTVCGTEWSARLRNGRPDVRLYPAATAGRKDGVVSPLTEWPRPRYETNPRPYESGRRRGPFERLR